MFPTRSEVVLSLRRALCTALEFATLGELVYEPEAPDGVRRSPEAISGARGAPAAPGVPASVRAVSGSGAAASGPRALAQGSLLPATAAARRALLAREPTEEGAAERPSTEDCPYAGRAGAARRTRRTASRGRRAGQPKPVPQPCLCADGQA